MNKRNELLNKLNGWLSIDKFTAQEDVDHARAMIKKLRQEINAIDAEQQPTHVCVKCKRTDDGSTFLGFHGWDKQWEVCDNCAEWHGCDCCDALANAAVKNRMARILEVYRDDLPDYF